MTDLAWMDAQEAFLRRALEAMRRPHPDQQAIDAEAAWLLRRSVRTLPKYDSLTAPWAGAGGSPCDGDGH